MEVCRGHKIPELRKQGKGSALKRASRQTTRRQVEKVNRYSQPAEPGLYPCKEAGAEGS
jgi:hypothetical protein